ncbi:DNA/RNA nuclease SfsA [Paenibacillus sp. J5C_2022]|uniref:DNA/RNA nuclease SfsA n=1 Tax=Paenibacillus sp. J5C2022 TaxID=2977129 RepID=UPI0021D0B6E5|nr:DNA/RNA nuclease SfsA [Paenibacillus sp. J5C2022]MCU6707343.1 DNA/RNA nuclease SfsA [Paenibacillus sp. J5C2022]
MQQVQSGYLFKQPLIEGIICRRRNRFVMEVEIEGRLYDCHCPVTVRIGQIVFRNIPCLLSVSPNANRRTAFTVEAISADPPGECQKAWIGINQNAANRYVEHFLRAGQLSEMIQADEPIKREPSFGHAKLDFLAGDVYLEVKTPLTQLPFEPQGHLLTDEQKGEFKSFDRLLKQIGVLSDCLKRHRRAILLLCFMYEPPCSKPDMQWEQNRDALETIQASIQSGLEIWQIHLQITPKGVYLRRYYDSTSLFRQ